MPEQPELRLMADFLNQYTDNTCYGTEKSDVTKIQTVNLHPQYEKCKFVGAESRGKELKINFNLSANNPLTNSVIPQQISYIFTMGMSGNWIFTDLNTEKPKHSHFTILLEKCNIHMVDPRRFAKWKIGDWNPDRSPDPLLEPKEWWINYCNRVSKRKYDQTPIYELLMDQSLFNGVGNYIRAEVLYRMDVNPKLNHWDIDTGLLIKNIQQVMTEAYSVGGMEYSAFKNPNKINEDKNKGDWQVCYNKPTMKSIEDSNGRIFWYNPKWNL